MKKELKNLFIQLLVSNAQVEHLMNNIDAVKGLLKQYENLLIEKLKTTDSLANKIELELLIDDAAKAQLY